VIANFKAVGRKNDFRVQDHYPPPWGGVLNAYHRVSARILLPFVLLSLSVVTVLCNRCVSINRGETILATLNVTNL